MANDKDKSAKYYVPADLPKLENYFYFSVWIFHSIAAFIICYKTSLRYSNVLSQWTSTSSICSYMNGYRMDLSDQEWSIYRTSLLNNVLCLFIHSVSFQLVLKNLPQTEFRSCILISIWVILQWNQTSFQCIAICLLFATMACLITIISRSEIFAWLGCIFLVIKVPSIVYFSPSADAYYQEFNFYLYTLVKILNFCIYLSRKSPQIGRLLILRYIQYLFYSPYSTLLIVLYEDFDEQFTRAERELMTADLRTNFTRKHILKFFRLLFWILTFDFLLHFIYANLFFNLPVGILKNLHAYELASIAYVNGQLFHLKYIIMFGIPAWFAETDKLTPPAPPICISRISRYSRMWRYFDRGLYAFLKNQLYVPLMGDQQCRYFQIRRFMATVLVFFFVLSWHGADRNYISWVLLSALGLVLEKIGAYVWNTSFWSNLRNFIGIRNERRIIAACMNATVLSGICGVFFFLGHNGGGKLILERIVINGAVNLLGIPAKTSDRSISNGPLFLYLLILGYCYNNVCLQLDEAYTDRRILEKHRIDATKSKYKIK